jgi:hypothetical protein
LTPEEIRALPWREWLDLKRFADFRLGLKRDEDGEDVEYG